MLNSLEFRFIGEISIYLSIRVLIKKTRIEIFDPRLFVQSRLYNVETREKEHTILFLSKI